MLEFKHLSQIEIKQKMLSLMFTVWYINLNVILGSSNINYFPYVFKP